MQMTNARAYNNDDTYIQTQGAAALITNINVFSDPFQLSVFGLPYVLDQKLDEVIEQ